MGPEQYRANKTKRKNEEKYLYTAVQIGYTPIMRTFIWKLKF